MDNVINVIQGDTWVMTWLWTDSAGRPVDLSGCEIALQLRMSPESHLILGASNKPGGGLVLGPNMGEVIVTIDYAKTVLVNRGVYLCDMQITFPNGKRESSPMVSVNVAGSITR